MGKRPANWIFIAIALIATIALAAYGFVSSRSTNERVLHSAQVAADASAGQLNQYLAGTTQVSATAAQIAPTLRSDRAGMQRFLIGLLTSTPGETIHGVGLWYKQPQFAPYAHRTPQGSILVSYGLSQIKQTAIQNAQTGVTEPYFDKDHVYISAVHDMNSGGKSIGVAYADTTSGGIDVFLKQISNPQNFAYLTTATGQIAAFPQPIDLVRFAVSRHAVSTILDVTDADAAAFIAQRYPGDRLAVRTRAAGTPFILVNSFAVSALGGASPPVLLLFLAAVLVWALAIAAIVALRRALPRRAPVAAAPRTSNGKPLDPESALEGAIERGEIFVEYQPVYLMADRYLVGFEAFMRWRPKGQPVMHPKEFIAIAERTGVVLELDRHVAQLACRQISQWQREPEHLRLQINVSARHFEDVSRLRELIAVLQRCGLRPETLDIELTESAMMGLQREAVATVSELHALGVRLHLDDFGTGHSSLAFLQNLRVDALKIDKSFVAAMLHDDRAMQIVNAIVTLAQSLHIDLIAQGVESEAQARTLVQLGVKMGQGKFYGSPMPPEQAQRLLSQGGSGASTR